MSPRVSVTVVDATTRRRLIASPDGVLVLSERLRALRGGAAWCVTGCHVVTPDELHLGALDVREAYAAATPAALPYIAPLRDVGSTTPTREMVRP